MSDTPTLTEEEQRKERRKEIQRAAAKRYYEKNKEKVIKQNTDYLKKNREPHNKRCREYQKRKYSDLKELKNKLSEFEKLFDTATPERMKEVAMLLNSEGTTQKLSISADS